MWLGCSGNPADASALQAAGVEFLTLDAPAVLRGDVASAQYDREAVNPGQVALPMLAGEALMPVQHPIIGSQRDRSALQDYMQRISKRAQKLGMRWLIVEQPVRRPLEITLQQAWEQLYEFCDMASQIVVHHGITLLLAPLAEAAPEPSSLAQARSLCEQLGRESFGLAIDSGLLDAQGEEEIIEAGGWIRFARVTAEDFAEPGIANEGVDAFFSVLHKVGYDGPVSLRSARRSLRAAELQRIPAVRQAWDASCRFD